MYEKIFKVRFPTTTPSCLSRRETRAGSPRFAVRKIFILKEDRRSTATITGLGTMVIRTLIRTTPDTIRTLIRTPIQTPIRTAPDTIRTSLLLPMTVGNILKRKEVLHHQDRDRGRDKVKEVKVRSI